MTKSTSRNLSYTLIVTALAMFGCLAAQAATPNSGTLSLTSPELTFKGGPFLSIAGAVTPVTCEPGESCDDFALNVDLPADYAATHSAPMLRVEVSWSDVTGGQDLDFVIKNDRGIEVGTANSNSRNPEVLEMPAQAGRLTVTVVPFVTTGQDYTAKVSLLTSPESSFGDAPLAPAAPGIPRYYNYAPDDGIGEDSGEPSIGYNLATKKAMYISNKQTLRVTFPQDIAPVGSVPEAAEARWDDVSYLWTKIKSVDPILFTDQTVTPNRTFVSQLNSITQTSATGVFVGLNSFLAYTDDDGVTWTPAQINPPDGSYDHQTVGAGPYPSPIPNGVNPIYKNAVYYCAQVGVAALCSRSDDGGLTFGRAMPITGHSIHGHVKVAPDGTVYLPSRSGMAVSTDAGTTFTNRVPTGFTGPPSGSILDPSVGISKDAPVAPATSNTIYFCWIGNDGHAYASVSKDRGLSWVNKRDIGASQGIANAVFPEAVAGDSNRAACGFIGTPTGGDHQATTFPGTWNAYIAHTYDGGDTWTTVQASNNPVQRAGGICNAGTGCTGNNRNLLDFNEITLDENGRVLYSFADGCTKACESGPPNSFSSKAAIVRQSGGKGLLASKDSLFVEPRLPHRAFLSGRRDDQATYLTWRVPDNGGSDITRYNVYRRALPTDPWVEIGHSTGKAAFNDRAVSSAVNSYSYKVTAINGLGTGGDSNTISVLEGARVVETGACALPGVKIIADPTNDESSTLPQHDITSISVAEVKDPAPNPTGAASKIQFVMKLASGATPIPPGWRWSIRFNNPQAFPAPASTGIGATEDWFVAMVTSDGAAPTFTYGNTAVPQGAARVFVTLGNLDPASNISPDGTVTMILPKSELCSRQSGGCAAHPITPGTPINLTLGSVRASPPSALPGAGGTNETIMDITGAGSYTLRPSNLCLPNTPPVAAMVADVTSGNKPLTVNFNAAGSTDSDGIDTVSTYTFNFGDGTDDVVQSTPVASYTFTQAGVYDVKTVVADSRAMVSTNTAHQIIQVFSDNLPPIANLVADTTSGAAPLTVSFDASGSTDPDNSIASYTFDFGDGSAADTRSTPTVSHIYANQGTYTATLSVTDSLGKVSAALASVVISATRVPTLTITSIVPSSLCAGGPDTTVTITGTGFLPGATVVVNGSSRTATLTASQLTFTMTAAEIASPGNVSLRVVNTDESTSPGATLSVIADTLAPVVTPPAAVTVLQTTCTNSGVAAATPGSSPELAAFMAGATATDSCGVIAMAPQMAGADVTDSTVYSAGVHTVTFRFRDNAGHVGTATGTVTVRPSGDLDADDAVSATDLVILANYLVGNLAPESDTFKSTRVTADLNRDGAVNAVDIVVAANHLVGNIGCLAN